MLPPGQRERKDFPRFGMPAFASYRGAGQRQISVGGLVARPLTIEPPELKGLERVAVIADLNCVTTWTVRQIRWEGIRFRDVFERLIGPGAEPADEARWVSFKADDGYRASLLMDDALASDVILAEMMNGEPLSNAHGAYWRLIAPAHYAYKNVKHLASIDFWNTFKHGPGLLEHPRARVALEERGRILPGKLLRYLYKPLITPTIRRQRG